MKEQSHKDEMSAAIRGDFQRLRDRGVAATLAPDDPPRIPRAASTDVPEGPLVAAEALPDHPEAGVAHEVEPEPGPEVVAVGATPSATAPEPPADAGDELRDGEQPGFFARLLGR